MFYNKFKLMNFPTNSHSYIAIIGRYCLLYIIIVDVYIRIIYIIHIGVLADVLTRFFKTGSRKTSTVALDNVRQQFWYVAPQQTHEHETRQKGTSVFVRMTRHKTAYYVVKYIFND